MRLRLVFNNLTKLSQLEDDSGSTLLKGLKCLFNSLTAFEHRHLKMQRFNLNKKINNLLTYFIQHHIFNKVNLIISKVFISLIIVNVVFLRCFMAVLLPLLTINCITLIILSLCFSELQVPRPSTRLVCPFYPVCLIFHWVQISFLLCIKTYLPEFHEVRLKILIEFLIHQFLVTMYRKVLTKGKKK